MVYLNAGDQKRAPKENAFDVGCLEYAKIDVEEFINDGAKSKATQTQAGTALPTAPAGSELGSKNKVVPRRTNLFKADFEEYGFTPHCPGCKWLQTPVGSARHHSERCRERIEAELAKEEKGRVRLQRARDRIDFRIAEEVSAEFEEAKANNERARNHGEPGREVVREDVELVEGDVLRSELRMPDDKEEEELEEGVQLVESQDRGSEMRGTSPERMRAVKRNQRREGGEEKASSSRRRLSSPTVSRTLKRGQDVERETVNKQDEKVD